MTKSTGIGKGFLRHSSNRVHWIPDFIRRERVRQGLTLSTLAYKVNARASHISNYETGCYSIRAVLMLERILAALGYELHIRKKDSTNGKAQSKAQHSQGTLDN